MFCRFLRRRLGCLTKEKSDCNLHPRTCETISQVYSSLDQAPEREVARWKHVCVRDEEIRATAARNCSCILSPPSGNVVRNSAHKTDLFADAFEDKYSLPPPQTNVFSGLMIIPQLMPRHFCPSTFSAIRFLHA